MADEGMDPCECIWGHEMTMRRLLSLLRQSQSYCTDNECFQDGNQNQATDSGFMLVTLFLAFAMLMYYMRPNRTSNPFADSPSKPDSGGNGTPPPPPTAL